MLIWQTEVAFLKYSKTVEGRGKTRYGIFFSIDMLPYSKYKKCSW